jgi:hypothetical protein
MAYEDEAVRDREESQALPDRRRGPRRVDASGSFDTERRGGDRRRRRPGIAALFGAILGLGDLR